MSVKSISMCLVCSGALLVSCGSSAEKKAAATADAEKTAKVGDDKDEHGCITSAGYTWSEVQKDCIRLWEKGVRMEGTDDGNKTLFLVFSPDSTQVELFFSGQNVPDEILDRRSLPSGGYAWNMEDDDTKNVCLKYDKWIVSQRDKTIYVQAKSARERRLERMLREEEREYRRLMDHR